MGKRHYIWEVKAKEAVGNAEEYCHCLEESYPKEQGAIREKGIWTKEAEHMVAPSEAEGV